MSTFFARQIIKPKWYEGVRPISKGFPHSPVISIGMDTESVKGRPHTIQFSYPPGTPNAGDFITYWPDPQNTFSTFLNTVSHTLQNRHKQSYIIWCHNLEYELTQIFRQPTIPQTDWISTDLQFENEEGTVNVRIFNGNLKAVFIRYGKRGPFGKFITRSSVRIIDTFAYFKTSLDNAAKQCGIMLPKLPKPEGLGERHLTDPGFEEYAKRDATLARLIGESIVDQCKTWDIPVPISAPQMSGYVFRKHYLSTTIDKLPSDAEQASLESYHGGKNGYYLSAPMEGEVYQADIRSAYPYAFTQIPEPENAELVYTEDHEPGSHGVCEIDVDLNPCQYGVLQNHPGTYERAGGRVKTTVTIYEYESALNHGEIAFTHSYRAFCLISTKEPCSLSNYAIDLFQRRKTDPPNESYYKLMLNSLYGKFIQKTPEDGMITLGQETRFRCGALYHPLLASLITGYIRALLHDCEHKYDVIMTSTDGFFCRKPPEAGDRLGDFKVLKGRLKVFRGRLYTFRVDGKIIQWAAHGFRGTRDQLDRLSIHTHVYTYLGVQVVTNKIAARQGLHPGEFVEKSYQLIIRPPP